jgi:hypothetical protein
MSPRRGPDPSAFRHYLRVRIGIDGPKGRLLHCDKRHGSGKFWKVKLDSGAWVLPEGLILDGPGDRVATCRQCGLSFVTGDRHEVLCRLCQEVAFGTTARAKDDEDPVARRNVLRRRRAGDRAKAVREDLEKTT